MIQGLDPRAGPSMPLRRGQLIQWLDSRAGPSVAITPRQADFMVGFLRCHRAKANYFNIDSRADRAEANYFNIDSRADCAEAN